MQSPLVEKPSMEVLDTRIQGLKLLRVPKFVDRRGEFVKVFQTSQFLKRSLVPTTCEEFYTISTARVLRGLHFQVPPFQQFKLVYCLVGEVLDVVVDLRKGSPTFGEAVTFRLSSAISNLIYIPPGCAHGFYVLSQTAVMVYKVSSEYSPEHDQGIHWNSIGFDWPDPEPIISARDQGFAPLPDFESPFDFLDSHEAAGG